MYDFVPELKSELWDNHTEFIKWRKKQMLDYMESQYGIKVVAVDKNDNVIKKDNTRKNDLKIENLGNLGLKILGILHLL